MLAPRAPVALRSRRSRDSVISARALSRGSRTRFFQPVGYESPEPARYALPQEGKE